ncbi:MAG: hypothetical protein PVH84_02835 [Candidatus Aminicenantes bacterium]|jgi:hypothetical protein
MRIGFKARKKKESGNECNIIIPEHLEMMEGIRAKNKYGGLTQSLAIHLILLSCMVFLQEAPQQQKYALSFSPTVGDIFHYQLDLSLAAGGKDFQGKDISLEGNASGELLFTIKRNIANQVAAVVTTPGIRFDSTEFEQHQGYTLITKNSEAVRVSFNHKGGVTQVHNLEALNTKSIGNISFEQILSKYLPTLPDKAVAVGETWSDSQTFSIAFKTIDLDVILDRDYVLLNVQPAKNGDIAIISISYSVELSGSRNWEDWAGGFEGQGTGTGSFLFNIQRSCIQQFNVEYGTEATLVIRKKERPVLKQPFRLSVTASFMMMQ